MSKRPNKAPKDGKSISSKILSLQIAFGNISFCILSYGYIGLFTLCTIAYIITRYFELDKDYTYILFIPGIHLIIVIIAIILDSTSLGKKGIYLLERWMIFLK